MAFSKEYLKRLCKGEGGNNMAISREYLREVCKLGKGEECCSYLICSAAGFECAKGTEFEEVIKTRRTAGEMIAKGDNCKGFGHKEPDDLN